MLHRSTRASCLHGRLSSNERPTMPRSDLARAYDFSIKGIVAKVTLLMSILSTVRFFVDVYRLPLNTLVANILKTYQVVFHTCVDVLLIWLPYRLPSWGKDLLIFYLLFAFIYHRVLFRQILFNYRHPWIIRHNFKNSKVLFVLKAGSKLVVDTLIWPFKLWTLLSTPYLVVAGGGHGPSALYFSKDRPIEGRWQGLYLGDARIMMLIRITAIIAGSLIVMMFNYAFSI